MFTKHLVNTAELNGVIKDQKRKPLEREVDRDLAPASKRCVLIFLLFYFLFKTLQCFIYLLLSGCVCTACSQLADKLSTAC